MVSIITYRGVAVETMGPRVNIINWLLTGLATIFLILRVLCKFQTHRRLWWDDHLLITAWVFQVVAVSLITYNITLGFGMHRLDIDPANVPHIALISLVVTTVSMFAAVLSKTSFAVTLLRISKGYTKLFVWIVIVVMNVAMGLGALFQWIQCTPVRMSWDFTTPGTCWDRSTSTAYAIFAAAISGTMDATLALLPWTIIWTLQMKTNEKLGVAVAMSMGVFAGITALVKCTKLPGLQSDDVPFLAADVAIWGSAEVTTTIMAACIPVLRVLLNYVKSSARKYYSPNGPSSSHAAATRTTTTVVASASRHHHHTMMRSQGGSGKEDDTGSDKSILEREARSGSNKIVQTHEFTVEFHNQDRDELDKDEETGRMGVYEMKSRNGSV